ncbi:MAG: hypothetical protein HZB31_08090 [Nitrospirae bacterium]|nr:hypothetical protein [Nitrospirota bacterium]
MKDQFERTTINGLTFDTRSVRSATWEGMICIPPVHEGGIYCAVEKRLTDATLKMKGGRQ